MIPRKLKSLLHLSPKACGTLIGLFMFFKGFWLCMDRTFWFYPPGLKALMNAPVFDYIMMAIGFLILVLAFLPQKIKYQKWWSNCAKVLLAVSAFFVVLLALLAITHGAFTAEYRMGHGFLGDTFIFAIIMLTAGDI